MDLERKKNLEDRLRLLELLVWEFHALGSHSLEAALAWIQEAKAIYEEFGQPVPVWFGTSPENKHHLNGK